MVVAATSMINVLRHDVNHARQSVRYQPEARVLKLSYYMASVDQSMNPGEPGGVSPRILRLAENARIHEESRGLRHRARLGSSY